MRHLIVATFSIAIASIAHAGSNGFPGNTLPLPEPETLALVGIGAVAIIIARCRHKK